MIGTNQGVIVGMHGLFNRGKTFVLNKLADTHLPSERRITTVGLSFKEPERYIVFSLCDSTNLCIGAI